MNKTIELAIKVFLKDDIKFEDCLATITDLVDKALSKNKKYLEFHKENKFKFYSFDMLYPLSIDKVYKKDNIYTFRLRSIDPELIKYLVSSLENEYTDTLKVLTIFKKLIPKKQIVKLYSITPVIIKFDEGYWKTHTTIDEVKRRIKENIIKKYNSYYNTKIDEDFELFKSIELKNKLPVKVNYKEVGLLGDKFEFMINEDKTAQDLVNFAVAVGLGEMNARGLGFTNYIWK